METYVYNERSWRSSPTTSDCNSFFHSAFGIKTNERKTYFDENADYRRMEFVTFLTYFKNKAMTNSLMDILRKCFSVNDECKNDDKQNLTTYISGLKNGEQSITKEDIPILATLGNIKVVILSTADLLIIEPNLNMLGHYPKREVSDEKTVVLSLEGNFFSRLESVSQGCSPEPDKNKVEERRLKKRKADVKYGKLQGSGGAKGIEYQVSLLEMVILKLMNRNSSGWKLSTENKNAGNIDDIVFEGDEGDVLIQSKYRENEENKLTWGQLTAPKSKNDAFSLLKYFLSYISIKQNFNVRNVIICSNVRVHEKVLKKLNRLVAKNNSILNYEEGICSFYTFKIDKELLEDLKNKTTRYCGNEDNQDITYENFKDFLNKLQLYVDYPALNRLKEIIKNILTLTKCYNNTQSKITPENVYSKVMDWFQQPEGEYYTEIHAKALFANIWTEKYCEILKEYHLKENYFNLKNAKQILFVKSSHGHLLQTIQIYHTVQTEKGGTLYVNPNDDIHIQKLILEAFSLPRYKYLIISNFNVIKEMCTELRDILKDEDKKVVLISNDDSILRCITENKRDYDIIESVVLFSDLSEQSQDKLLLEKCITFQGKSVSLRELFDGQVNDDNVKSEVIENIIRKEQIKVGVPTSKFDATRFYIKRKFKNFVGEVDEDDIYDVKENIVIISSSAGMGKSSVLSNLATNIKEKYPNLWVIEIALTKYIKFLNENGRSLDINELLNSDEATKLTSCLENLVFSIKEKVVLMIDGIDEISLDSRKLVFNMLSQCVKATNFKKLFITMRPHMVHELKSYIKVEPFELQPFTKKQQVEFLIGNLDVSVENKEQYEKYVEILLEKGYNEDEFTAVPLQLEILAEYLKAIIELNQSSASESYSKCLNEVKEIEMRKIYTMFIEKKRKIYINSHSSGTTDANKGLYKLFHEYLGYHKALALEVILNVEDLRYFSCYQKTCEDNNESILSVGIVQKSKEEYHFNYSTVAKYFVAESIISELKLQSGNPSVGFQKFFIDKVLQLPEYKIIRAFLDSFLKETEVADSISSNPFERYQSQCLNFLLNEYDCIKEEGCNAILQLMRM